MDLRLLLAFQLQLLVALLRVLWEPHWQESLVEPSSDFLLLPHNSRIWPPCKRKHFINPKVQCSRYWQTRLVTNFSTSLQKQLSSYNDALVRGTGTITTNGKNANIRDRTDSIFNGGSWTDWRKIPILSGAVSAEYLAEFYYNVIVAQAVNYAWQKQGVYFSCYPMTLAQCTFSVHLPMRILEILRFTSCDNSHHDQGWWAKAEELDPC